MFDDTPSPLPSVPAGPGHVALYQKGRALYRNDIVAWIIDGSAEPVTLFTGDTPCVAVVFPDGHVEDFHGVRRWPSVAAFCKARRLTLAKE